MRGTTSLLRKTTMELRIGTTGHLRYGIVQKLTFARFLASFDFRLFQHGVIPGSSQTKARESALQEHMRPAPCGLATMESDNGILCRTGRVVEADINLRGGPGGACRTRGRGRFRSRGDIGLRNVKSTECSTYWP